MTQTVNIRISNTANYKLNQYKNKKKLNNKSEAILMAVDSASASQTAEETK